MRRRTLSTGALQRVTLSPWSVALGALLFACSPRPSSDAKNPADAAASVPATEISDAEFAATVHELLLSHERGERERGLLAGAVKKQLTRAETRFRSGHTEAGDDALTGAFFLLGIGELSASALDGTEGALRSGASEAARVGNAGRSRALYHFLESTLPPGSKLDDVKQHLAAINAYTQEQSGPTPLQAASVRQHERVQESLLNPSLKVFEAARGDIADWIRAALDSDVRGRPLTSLEDRQEAIEVHLAQRSSDVVNVALHLRYQDPLGAIESLEEANLAHLLHPNLREMLRLAGEENESAAWLELYRLFHRLQDPANPHPIIDRRLAQGAAWGAAAGLYRSAPGAAEPAMPMSLMLTELGMGEVAVELLARNVDSSASTDALSWALGIVLRSIVDEEREGTMAAARRCFANAQPLLELADQPKYKRVNPSPGRLDYVMGALETRAGHLDRALPLVEQAVSREPTTAALSNLAAIQRQKGRYDEATRSLQAAVELARASGDLIEEAELEELIFQTERSAGRAEPAAGALRWALVLALTASRLEGAPESTPRVERLLGRIFEHYGEDRRARLASDRALDASLSNVRQLAATLTDMARGALSRSDVRAARRATQRALEARLPPEDLVYIALWEHLLERQVAESDGTVLAAWSNLAGAEGWVGALRDWGRGELSDDALLKMASTPVEKTEAHFYVTMAQIKHGQLTPQQRTELEQVARSPAIDLVEVAIARDYLSQMPPPPLPTGVELPY